MARQTNTIVGKPISMATKEEKKYYNKVRQSIYRKKKTRRDVGSVLKTMIKQKGLNITPNEFIDTIAEKYNTSPFYNKCLTDLLSIIKDVVTDMDTDE